MNEDELKKKAIHAVQALMDMYEELLVAKDGRIVALETSIKAHEKALDMLESENTRLKRQLEALKPRSEEES